MTSAAKKYGVAPTTLNRLLVWAWAAAGPTDPTQETSSITTARQKHREFAHRTKFFTQPLADAFLETTWSPTTKTTAAAAAANTATPQAGPPPYKGPPKGLAQMMGQHESPQAADANAHVAPLQIADKIHGEAAAAAEGESNENSPGPPRRRRERLEGLEQTAVQHESPQATDTNTHAAPPRRTDGTPDDAAATAGGEDDGSSPGSRRRLNDTPDNGISLRHYRKYGTMMGETSVTIADINDTAQYLSA